MLLKSGWPTWQAPTSKSTGTLVRSRVRSLLSTATSTTGFAHVRTEVQSVRGELFGRVGPPVLLDPGPAGRLHPSADCIRLTGHNY